ncbi:MAG: TolB family protein [Terriglobales bacterium]
MGDSATELDRAFFCVQVEGLDWSPDEKWLALRARTPDKPWLIYVIPSEGGKMQMLMPSEKEQGIPSWSRDSKTIAFGDVSAVFDTTNGTDSIHLIDVQSRMVTDIPGSRGLWTARWSPNGRYLAALTMVGQRLMLFDIKYKSWRQIDAVKVNNLTWSKDSESILLRYRG